MSPASLPLPVLLLATLPQAAHKTPQATYDIAATGAHAKGGAGDVVKVTVGITNKGPETYIKKGGTSLMATWTFTPPPGTETVRPPDTEVSTIFGSGGAMGANKCESMSGGDSPLGRGPYSCFSTATLEPGESSKGTFYLKIIKVIPNATGSVTRWDCTKPPVSDYQVPEDCTETPADRNPDNDEAEVIINP